MKYMKRNGPCSAEGCADPITSRGLCYYHYMASRVKRRPTARNRDAYPERVERWIERDPNSGCWLWSGTCGSEGRYGHMAYRGKFGRVHRFAFEHYHRPLREGEVVCHTCDTSLCVNPAHLWAGTQGENMRDMYAKGRARPRGIPQRQTAKYVGQAAFQ